MGSLVSGTSRLSFLDRYLTAWICCLEDVSGLRVAWMEKASKIHCLRRIVVFSPFDQSVRMAEEYRRVGLPVEFIAVKNAGRDLQHIRGGSRFTFGGDCSSEHR
jgi:hypothetical protein